MKWKGLSNPQNVIWRIPYSETWHGKISEQWWQTEGSKTFRVARPTVIVRQMANSELKIVIIADFSTIMPVAEKKWRNAFDILKERDFNQNALLNQTSNYMWG